MRNSLPANELVWTRQIGSARLAVITEGGGWWPIERALDGVPPEDWRPWVQANDANTMWVDFNLVHVTLPGCSILLDTGFGDVDPNDPAHPLISVRDLRLTPGRDAALARLRVAPDDVTHVVITHCHGDHVVGAARLVDGQWVPAFPRARYYVTRAEWLSSPEWHQSAEAITIPKRTLEASGQLELIDGESEIAPGVTLIPAPGESPGHQIVRIATGNEIIYYLGDLFHQPAEFRHLDWIPRFRDREALIASRRRLLPRFVDENAWLIVAHHPFPGIGRVIPHGDSYDWRPIERDS